MTRSGDTHESGDKFLWKTSMRFMRSDENQNELWIKGELIFTDKGIYWNGERNIQYSGMKYFTFYDWPSSRGLSHLLAKLRGGRTIEVYSDSPTEHFEFGNSASFTTAVQLLSRVFKK